MTYRRPRGLVWRALAALALMVGFYAIAAAVLAALWYGVYAQARSSDGIHLGYLLVAGVGTVVIVAAVIPRRDKFIEPGIRLPEDGYPDLFREIGSVAQAAGQEMPADVYLIPELNAWVEQRGGRLGWGGRKVMALGLPLLNLLTVSEFRAVLAHEFGHFHGGDTDLAPLVYRARSAIARTVRGLACNRSVLEIPFLLYGKLYLRATHGMSRLQEHAADVLAARIAGPGPLAEGLERIHKFAAPYAIYWRNEYLPVLASGYHAPMLEGFSKFLEDPRVEKMSAESLDEQKAGISGNPYVTHPPLGERLRAIAEVPAAGAAVDDSPAVSLLGDVEAAERELALGFLRRYGDARLVPIAWDDVASVVYIEQWTNLVRERGTWLKGVTPEDLPELAGDVRPLAARYQAVVGSLPPGAAFHQAVAVAVGASLAVHLAARGWTLSERPSLGFVMRREGRELRPFGVLPGLALGEIEPDAWRSECAQAGIAGADLGSAP